MTQSWILWALNGAVLLVALAAFLVGKAVPIEAVAGFLVGYIYVNICVRAYFGRWLGD